jgi:SAM-dependent methyltransferase
MSLSNEVKSSETMARAIHEITNYHNWIFDVFKPYTQEGISLEVGSGHGIYSRKILPFSKKLYVSDIDSIAISKIKSELGEDDKIKYLVMDGIDSKKIDNKIDNIFLINILEHIPDDRKFLKECLHSLTDSGKIFLFVPAFQLLYSEIDKNVGHQRRYEKRELLNLVEESGFHVIKCRYFNFVGFFGWYLNKLIKNQPNSNSTNYQIYIFDRLLPILKFLDFIFPFLGQSLILVAEKKIG